MLLAFDGVQRPVDLTGCENLLPYLGSVLRDWPFEPASDPGLEPVIAVRRAEDGYVLTSPWLDEPIREKTEVGLVCSLVVDLVRAYVEDDSSLLCLHCGAVDIGGRLVIFPSVYRAGKSTLVARLAGFGLTVYADDVMPLTPSGDHGMSLSLAPRLRLPLPDRASPAFRDFVASHSGPRDDRYLYLDLPPDLLAPYRRTAPVGAFVLLERAASGPAELVPAARSHGLRRVILQNFARAADAGEILSRLRGLIDRAPCFTLRFSDLEDAAALLRTRFGDWSVIEREVAMAAGLREAVPPADDGALELSLPRRSEPRFVRHPEIALHTLDGDLFLADPAGQAIYHLNEVGAGLWNLLREPTGITEAIEILHGAFPEADRRRVKRDVTTLFGQLRRAGLIVPYTTPPDASVADSAALAKGPMAEA